MTDPRIDAIVARCGHEPGTIGYAGDRFTAQWDLAAADKVDPVRIAVKQLIDLIRDPDTIRFSDIARISESWNAITAAYLGCEPTTAGIRAALDKNTTP